MCIVLHHQFAFVTCPLYASWGIMFFLRPPPIFKSSVEFIFCAAINYFTNSTTVPATNHLYEYTISTFLSYNTTSTVTTTSFVNDKLNC